MLRLAHRILLQPLVKLPVWARTHEITSQPLLGSIEAQRGIIANSRVVIADNVADYAWREHLDGRPMDASKLPPVSPPLGEFFLEWNVPEFARDKTHGELQVGCLFNVSETKTGDLSRWAKSLTNPTDLPEGILDYLMTLYVCSPNGKAVWTGVCVAGRIPEGGVMPTECVQTLAFKDAPQYVRNLPSIAFITLAFMGCRNVTQADATDEQGPSAKWLRRQKLPRITYKILEIGSFRSAVRRMSGETDGEHEPRARHIVRGHFSHYTAERPLFGKYAGTFWVPAHERGDLKAGLVVKDYSLGAGVLSASVPAVPAGVA